MNRLRVTTTIAPWLAALACVVFIASAFYPGYMSPDSVVQLRQARTGQFDPWHPPFMAWTWRQIERVVPGPLGMLLFHCALFFTGLTLLMTAFLRPGYATLAVLAVGLFPSIAGLLSTVWKDVGMAAALLLAFALLLRFSQRPRWSTMALAFLALGYALAVRKNGVAAAVPLAAWAGFLVERAYSSQETRAWRGMTAGAMAAFALFGLTSLVNRSLSKSESFESQALPLYDLAAISVARNELMYPDWLKQREPRLDVALLESLYTPNSVSPLLWGEPPRVPMLTDAVENANLTKYWITAVWRNPGPYLKHRLLVVASMLGLYGTVYILPSGIVSNPYGYKTAETMLNRATMLALQMSEKTPVFSGWAYVVSTLLFFGLSRRLPTRLRSAAAALVASSACYLGPYLVISPSNDFRLIWWPVVVAVILPFVVFGSSVKTSPTNVSSLPQKPLTNP